MKLLAIAIKLWLKLSFRDLARLVGSITSMYPVFGERSLLRARTLQSVINIRHYHDYSWDMLDYI